jgi:predicted nucleic acid-binding protein
MMPARHDIDTYAFDRQSEYFLDTNVWLYVYGPMAPRNHFSRIYSNALKRLRNSGASVFIDVLVTSEFMNSWARLEYRRAGGDATFGEFKTFRTDAKFAPVAADIAYGIRQVLALANRTGTAFANINFDPVVDAFQTGSIDLCDQLIVETCRARKFVLLTNDGDMKKADVPIATANSSLLAP